MRRDPRIETRHLGVEVGAGKVTLWGTVNSLAARAAAQQVAGRTAGVVEVDNRLHVDISDQCLRTDREIARAVVDHLEWDAELPSVGIEVTVAGGVVTLQGRVNYEYQREVADRAIQHLAGVRGVVNKLAVATPLVHGPGPARAAVLAGHPVPVPHAPTALLAPRQPE
jgi:osmotically-inducible protein OsmY